MQVEHAIFTSVRGPMGEGYRIVSSTRGVTRDQRQEITRRSPSHGSLCAQTDDACGLSSYPLPDDHWAVACSQHAGMEHTGRGGYRVHTHVVVLQDVQFERFGNDPFAVADAMQATLVDAFEPQQPSQLEPLALMTQPIQPHVEVRPDCANILGWMMTPQSADQRVVFENAPHEWTEAAALFSVMPAAWRLGLSLSYGVRPAKSRDFHIVVLSVGLSDRRGPNEGVDWNHSVDGFAAPLGPWVRFIERACAEGRLNDVSRLARRINGQRDAHILTEFGVMDQDLQQVDNADARTLRDMMDRYANRQSASEGHRDLLERLVETIRARQAHLQETAAEAAD